MSKQKKRQEAKEERLLDFLKDEKFTTAETIGLLFGMKRTATYYFIKEQEQKGILKKGEVTFEVMSKGRGTLSVWGLTQTGVFLATKGESLESFDPSRTSTTTMTHEIELQKLKARSLNLGWGEWESGRVLRQKAHAEPKVWLQVPDGLSSSPSGKKCAFELERSSKSQERYEQIFSNFCQMLFDKTISEVIYVCPTERFAISIEKRFKKVETIILDGKSQTFNDSFRKKFHFVTYDGWEDYAKDL